MFTAWLISFQTFGPNDIESSLCWLHNSW